MNFSDSGSSSSDSASDCNSKDADSRASASPTSENHDDNQLTENCNSSKEVRDQV